MLPASALHVFGLITSPPAGAFFPSGQLNVYSKETAMGASAVLHKETQLNVRLKCLKRETAATFTHYIMEKRTELVEFRLNRSYILDVTKAFMNA